LSIGRADQKVGHNNLLSGGTEATKHRQIDGVRRLTAIREADSIVLLTTEGAVSHLLHEFMTGQTPEPLAKYDRMIWRLLTTAVPIFLIFGIASWFI